MCGDCVRACPVHACDLDAGGRFSVEPAYCLGCGACVKVCEDEALSMTMADPADLVVPDPSAAKAAEQRALVQKAKAEGRWLVSVFPMEGADAVWGDMGPREFLGAIQNAACVISNSFHATAFSLIFERDFYVFGRKEHINTRMADLVADVGLCDRLVIDPDGGEASPIPWSSVSEALERRIGESRAYLLKHTKG
jgi:ferredoxin